jgi:hypothetical protein
MNTKNFEYLRDQVKYTGFGEDLEDELKEQILTGKPNFSLNFDASYQDDFVQAKLNFNKSKETDMYFFNSYQVELHKDGAQDPLKQQFYVNFGNTVTMKEAYNLMNGRSVHKELLNKEGETYRAWLQLDFKESDGQGNFKIKHYHENYGYDLEKELAKHQIKELQHPQYKEELIESLKKGNQQSVNLMVEGQGVKHFIEANPQYKTVNLYDANLKKVHLKNHMNQQKGQQQQEKKTKKLKAADEETGEGRSTAKEKRLGQSIN